MPIEKRYLCTDITEITRKQPWLVQSVHRNSQRIRKRCTDTMETKGRTVDEKVRKGGGREEGRKGGREEGRKGGRGNG